MNEGRICSEWVNFTHDKDANMYENLTEEQNDILGVIKLEQDQKVNGVNVTWLSDFVQRDIHNDLIFVMNEGHIYDTINPDWVKAT